MRLQKLLLAAWVFLTCTCCNSHNQESYLLTQNDFDQREGWLELALPASFSTEQARSKPYALKVGAGQEYSQSYECELQQVCPFVPKRVRVSAWAYLPDGQVTGGLVLETSGSEAGRSWAMLNIPLVVKRYRKWVKVWKEFPLPDKLAGTDHLKLYLWCNNGYASPFYLDDLVVEAYP